MDSTRVVNFCEVLLTKAREKYGVVGNSQDIPSADLDRKALEFLQIIEESVNYDELLLEETLDFDETRQEFYDCQDEDENCTPLESESSQDWESEEIENKVFTLQQMQSIVKFYDAKKRDKLRKTQQRFPDVNNYQIISRFREYIDRNGTKADKLQVLESHVKEKFCEARNRLAYVCDRDLRRWGISKAKEIGLEFEASKKWLWLFKKRNRIVGRKVIKFVTKSNIQDVEMLETKAKEFVENVKALSLGIQSSSIFNFDQSGLNYELTRNRTLTHKGEARTLAVIQSKNSISHSYSVMPLISMSGKLAPKLLLCLQEPSGSFGPRVKAGLTIPPNIYLTCSKSGKLDKNIMRKWITEFVEPHTKDMNKIVLIHDAWTGQTDPSLYDSCIKNMSHRFVIPPHTTELIQLLDVYFFRQYKIICWKIYDCLILEGKNINLHTRDNIILLNSLVYNQIQSKKFQAMLTYPWFSCGYVEARSGYFLNANEILFNSISEICDADECNNDGFITCSHCDMKLCIDHFYFSKHFHD